LPAALVLWLLPAIFGAWRMVAGFRQIAESGAGGTVVPMRLSIGVAGLLWIGSFVLAVAIVALAVWQRRVWRVDELLEPPPEPLAPAPAWHAAALIVSSLAVVPVALVVFLTYSVTRLVPQTAMAIGVGKALGAVPNVDLARTSQMISARLLLAIGLGALTAMALVGFQCLNLFAIRPAPGSRVLERYTWFVAAAVGMAVAGALVALTLHLQWLNSAM
jgi:hypothetical protein